MKVTELRGRSEAMNEKSATEKSEELSNQRSVIKGFIEEAEKFVLILHKNSTEICVQNTASSIYQA